MDGRVYQVNVSPGGVPKLPVESARVGRLGLEGDAHDHRHVHGGPHRAICLMALEAIERVRADGHAIEPGAVGENVTTVGIDLSTLPVGTRLRIGDDVLLELSSPANPCDVIKGVFSGGKSGRISILLHPTDSRMYARVLAEGVVRPGDPISVLAPADGSQAEVHQLLDLLDSVERAAWLAMWQAAAESGFDVRVLDHGDLSAAASPDLPGSAFNRAFGLRQVPIDRPEVETLFRAAGGPGWLVLGLDDPAVAETTPDELDGVHVGAIDELLVAADRTHIEHLGIREVDPGDAEEVARWAELFVASFELAPTDAGAWRRFNPRLAQTRGYHQLIASLAGRDVAVSALFNRRRIGWLGAGGVLPDARGRGIQRALIADRIRRAAAAGSTRVMATAEVGGASATNLEAAGLRKIWTRGLFRFDPGAERAVRTAATATIDG